MRQCAYYHFYDQAKRGYYRDSSHHFQPSLPSIETDSADSYSLHMRIAMEATALTARGRHECCCHPSGVLGADGEWLDSNPWSEAG